MRAVGLDLGQRRIGVALSDSEGRMALPYGTLERARDRGQDHRRIAELVAETEADLVVVGMPISLDGSCGPAARRARREVQALRGVLPVPVETYDERFTTVSAESLLRESVPSGRRRREVIDTTAASVILQGWLDSRDAREQGGIPEQADARERAGDDDD
jgi:putative Holliday junction resolvase